MAKFNDRQDLFIDLYVKDPNATKAAIGAKYSEKTAASIGARLLRNVKVRTEIDRRLAKVAQKHEITAERVLGELAKLAFSNMGDYISVTQDGQAFTDLSKVTRDQLAAVQEIKVDETGGGGGDGRRERVQRTTFKLADKGLNLERLGRHLKLFTDKIEVTADDILISKLKAGRQRLTKTA